MAWQDPTNCLMAPVGLGNQSRLYAGLGFRLALALC